MEYNGQCDNETESQIYHPQGETIISTCVLMSNHWSSDRLEKLWWRDWLEKRRQNQRASKGSVVLRRSIVSGYNVGSGYSVVSRGSILSGSRGNIVSGSRIGDDCNRV